MNFKVGSLFHTIMTQLAGKAASVHTHVSTSITDFTESVDALIDAKKGENNGLATLDSGGKVPAEQLPSYVDDVLEYADYASLPLTGEAGKIYILATPYSGSSQFRWSGSAYAAIIASPGTTDAVTEGSTNLYFTASRVLSAVLTGFNAGTAAAVAATDTVLQALQKLQTQITDNKPEVLTGTTNSNGDVTFNFAKTYGSVPKVFPSIVGGGDANTGVLYYISALSTTSCTIRAMKTRSTVVVLLNTNVDPDVALASGVTVNLLVHS